MPVHLPPDEARRFLETGELPAPHLDVIAAMAFHAAAAGVALGVFDALAAGPRTAAALAAELDAAPDALGVLLEVLAATGYLERATKGYRNGLAGRALTDGYGGTLRFWHDVITGLWGGLEHTIRHGERAADFYAWLPEHPDTLERFRNLLRAQAGWLAEEIVDAVPLPPGAARLLDLGGGHARYTAAYCDRYPGLRATIVDLPSARPEPLPERVTLRHGDLLAGWAERDQDCVLMFNLLHGFPTGRARALVRDAVASLRPGGLLLILDRFPGEREGVAGAAFTRAFELNLLHTQGGRLHSPDEIAIWITDAGGTPPARHRLDRSPGHALLASVRGPSGTRPAGPRPRSPRADQ
ncbi:Ubiquinone/menaquinone biosynthesis C-methylase UbiE [Thermomonospora echinospora]|uniref:Ubiquinone/menaquinone biosynthesis C-methylase UbiE n=1 Tax=Thermomonospora echinospora TaxID=1992 RepID=A0A1H5XHF7_9ACTN|nr:class I SAM-dependent methyltransferase [Thermomonospora echinospora]SEG10807.1 Ubiquinone/menaquinone biosynthesis C-methylase UbiE [Thermomonospora echinospora]